MLLISSVYLKLDSDGETAEVIELMRVKLAKEFGVTVVGNRCTLRWWKRAPHDGHLVQVHMIIEEVTTPSECQERHERDERYQELIKKNPWLAEELHFAEHGEYHLCL